MLIEQYIRSLWLTNVLATLRIIFKYQEWASFDFVKFCEGKLFSEVLGEHYHASNNFSEVPLSYEPKKYKLHDQAVINEYEFNHCVSSVHGK
jgi:hypothetical protein